MSSGSFICLLQEPYTYHGRVCYMPTGIQTFQHPDARACIPAAANLNLWEVASLSTRNRMCCVLKLNAEAQFSEIILASLYLDIEFTPDCAIRLLGEIADYANGRQVILGVDTNAHSTLWGSPINNARGDGIEEFLFQHNLEILNIAAMPTFQTV